MVRVPSLPGRGRSATWQVARTSARRSAPAARTVVAVEPQSPSDRSSPISWRGAAGGPGGPTDPFDPWSDTGVEEDPDGDAAAQAANERSRRVRRLAVIGVAGLVLAATIVTGTGGDGDGAPAEDDVTGAAVEDEPDPDPDVAVPRLAGEDDPPATTRPTDRLPSVDELAVSDGRTFPSTEADAIGDGLRYGGAGGGADIRRATGPTDTPLPTRLTAGRLPDSVEPLWTTTVELDRAAGAAAARSIDVQVGERAVVAAIASGGEVLVTGFDPVDGTRRWSTTVDAPRATIVEVGDGVIGVARVLPVGEEISAMLLLDEVDGSVVPSIGERPAREQAALLARLRSDSSVEPDRFADRTVVVADGASAATQRAAEELGAGDITVVRADRVSAERTILLAGGMLIGVRDGVPAGDTDASDVLVDWARPGVLLGWTPSDRGATLLVSDQTGGRQSVVDAATGEVITDVRPLASSLSVYTPTENGVIVKRSGWAGSALSAFDLDGREIWRLDGSPSFAVGDEVVVTASLAGDRVTLVGRG